jgi:tetratricopeptide (TPR) repeat protein
MTSLREDAHDRTQLPTENQTSVEEDVRTGVILVARRVGNGGNAVRFQKKMAAPAIRIGCAIAVTSLLAGATSVAAQPAQSSLGRGIAALHYFEYEEANESFRAAHRLDARLVMACWGEAMTYHQTLWRNEDLQQARAALARCGATPALRAANARSRKDLMFLDAADALFGAGDATARRQRYADAMAALYAREPDDPDVAAFYALALLGTMSRGLIGSVDPHEGHSRALAGSETQKQVNGILQKVLLAHPSHPGALHYLLHNNDDPEHARIARGAARSLARLAPDSSHALHMPAHIFVQLGAWTDAVASDTAAYAASDAWVKRKGLPAAMRSYHALAWKQYELLQLGRYRDARAALDDIEPVVKSDRSQLTLLSDLSTMRARYVVETASWPLLARQDTFGNADELFAIGMSAARTGNGGVAERARQALAGKARDEREGDLRPAIAIMEREVAASIAFAAGRRDEAIDILRAAAEEEARLPAPMGLPEPIKPAPELLGEVLIDAGRASEAEAFFDAALQRNPKRSLSLAGRARAAAASGRHDRARAYYTELLANFESADADLALVHEARSAIAVDTVDRTPPRWVGLFTSTGGLMIVGLFAAIIVAAAMVLRRSMKPAPVRAKKTGAPKRARKKQL